MTINKLLVVFLLSFTALTATEVKSAETPFASTEEYFNFLDAEATMFLSAIAPEGKNTWETASYETFIRAQRMRLGSHQVIDPYGTSNLGRTYAQLKRETESGGLTPERRQRWHQFYTKLREAIIKK